MRKIALVVLAASSILPLLVSRASPPDEEPVPEGPQTVWGLAVSDSEAGAEPSIKLFGADLPEAFELPEELGAVSQEERRDVIETYLRRVYPQRRESWPVRPGGPCLAADGANADLCAAAARISYSRPCLAAGDCPALEDWKEVMGRPGLRQAPRSTARAAARTPSPRQPPGRD